jgi:Na+/H+ antiporter NhaD/arsenite permease-like protein
VADNLTSALLMATVALAVSGGNKRFIVPSFVNIIVAANAGGAWSPFGDITTLMVWTSGKIHTFEFIYLLIPSIINWFVPAFIMFPFIPEGKPVSIGANVELKPGAKVIMVLGALTIIMAVSFHQFLHLPPFLGMMFGLGFLMFEAYYLNVSGVEAIYLKKMGIKDDGGVDNRFNFFKRIEGVEFDTLLFFFGVLVAVGALQYIGYLAVTSDMLYGKMGPTVANIVIGVFSAILDNIPLMYAVLKMDPAMGFDQWLLITLTTGVGGSLLSVGSAAGVAVMGVDRKNYTFMAHLKWAPAIAAGYFAGIGAWWLVTAGLR